jgi:hypothetical protein
LDNAYTELTDRLREGTHMRHRLYYLLPDIDSARRALDDMLLSRIERLMMERHPEMRFAGEALGVPIFP